MIRAMVMALLAFLALPAEAADPVIEAGREAEIEALFAGVGAGELGGWKTGDIRIEGNLIIAGFERESGGGLEIRLAHPAPESAAAARLPAFDLFIHSSEQIDEQKALQFARALAADLKERVGPDFWRAREVIGRPERKPEPMGIGRWFMCPAGLTTLAWLAGLLSLLVLVGIGIARARPWQSAEGRRVLIEMSIVFVAALLVRWLLVPWGPGNFHHHPPDPHHPGCGIGFLGPGQGAWTLLWAWLFGAGDGVLFFSGAFCGAAAAPAAYLLVWDSTNNRLYGLAAAAALALWPAHALLSPTDDAYGLAVCFFLSAMALVARADKNRSELLLAAGWLAGVLAAAVRPDFYLMLLVLAAQVFWQPVTRSMQLKVRPLLAAGLLGAVALVSLWLVKQRMVGFELPVGFSNLASLGCLAGVHPASILRPPWSQWPLLALAVLGLLPALTATRYKAALWLGAALVSPFIFYGALRGDFISARYQMFLAAAGALAAGMGVAWLWERRRVLGAASAVLALAGVAWTLVAPPPEPVFRMEYRFFRKHIESVPKDCRIMWIDWTNDVGLYPPKYLSSRLGLEHEWLRPRLDAKVESRCTVYWRPGMCATSEAVWEGEYPDNFCHRIPRAYRLEPIAETRLPARPGHAENYPSDEVAVGFYRLRKPE